MGATAVVTVLCTASGLPEGGIDQVEYSITNTSAANEIRFIEVSTAQATAQGVTPLSSAKVAMLIPPSTNTFPWRLTGSTAEAGILMSSRGPALLGCQAIGIFFYTTAGTTFQMRWITY